MIAITALLTSLTVMAFMLTIQDFMEKTADAKAGVVITGLCVFLAVVAAYSV